MHVVFVLDKNFSNSLTKTAIISNISSWKRRHFVKEEIWNRAKNCNNNETKTGK